MSGDYYKAGQGQRRKKKDGVNVTYTQLRVSIRWEGVSGVEYHHSSITGKLYSLSIYIEHKGFESQQAP